MKKLIAATIVLFTVNIINAQINYEGNKVEGKLSSALGIENVSNGITSFATGNLNIAEGDFSFVTGYESQSLGNYSFASGRSVIADGLGSCAFGDKSSATGNTSGAFGIKAIASGKNSFAFGYQVQTIMPFSMVIGKGLPSEPLLNTVSNSFMVGFNSNIPTFFVGTSSGTGTLGKVGIGTTTPGSRLQINGNLAIGYDELTAAPENGICINGKMGIGISTPSSQLQITNNMAIGYSRSTTAPNQGVCIKGNVGIGTTTPTEKLHVNGKVKLNAVMFPDGTEIRGTEDLGKWQECETGIQYTEGKVCIGASSPDRPLTIEGTGNNNELLSFKDQNGFGKWHLNLKSGGLNFAQTGSREYSLFIKEGGQVGISCGNPKALFQVGSGYKSVSMGSAASSGSGWGIGYIGLNAARDPNTKIWNCYGDGSHNGGSVIYGTIGGWVYISSISSTGGGDKTFTDRELKSHVQFRLSPSGKLMVKEVEVLADLWPDYVFEDDYKLQPLHELEDYIKTHKHLPGVPPQEKIKEDGLNLGDMDALLLKKMEEMTLYIIEQNKRILELQNQIDELKK